ncbi:MAG: amidohydrolase family protein [Rhodospirillales bacterium]|nr:amidohydrolase family protein [Rhodospirillales bacterium]
MDAPPRDPMPVIDAHHHLWDLDGAIPYGWLRRAEPSFLGDYAAIRRSYLPAEYRRDAALHHVVATVHVEAECDRTHQIEETAWLHTIAARHGMPNAVVAHAWVDTPDAEEMLARQAAFPLVRGIRTKPMIAAGPSAADRAAVAGAPRSLQDKSWRRGLALLVRHGLSWDLRVPWYHLQEAADVVRGLPPALAVMLNHAGYPWDRSAEGLAVWRRGMAALAACPNVHCKISSLIVPGQAWTLAANLPIIRDALAIFGIERCVYASNYPVDRLQGSFDYVLSAMKAALADHSPAEQAAFFAENARRFYRIGG